MSNLREQGLKSTAATEIHRLGVTGLTAAFARRELSPEDALEAFLERIDAFNPVLNAIVSQDRDRARGAARESAARWRLGTARGPLDGVPMVIKDSIVMRGLPTTWGSRLYADFHAETDETPVARLRAGGAVLLGKTNAPEFTISGHTDNGLFGVTRNPWNPALTPGGSSGGSVAAVAAGMVPAALGTDGGGSIRRPCALTGLVGLKPTVGRVGRSGGLPVTLADLEVAGPIARSVADLAAVYHVIAGPDPLDRASRAFPAPPEPTDLETPPDPLRVLYVPRFGDSPVDPEIAASVARLAGLLGELGHVVEEGLPPFDPDDFATGWPVVSQTGVAWLVRDRDWEGHVDANTEAAIRRGREFDAIDYAQAMDRFRSLRAAVGAAFERFDVILTPSSAALPWPATLTHPAEIDGRPASPRDHAAFTGFVNAAGNPAIAVPCQPAASGLPIGAQMVGDLGNEAMLLRLAAQIERAVPWADRWPHENAIETRS